MASKKQTLWEPYQHDFWKNKWDNSEYTMQDKINGDKWVSVKCSPMLPYVLKYTPKNARILEAGCGMGQWVIYLADLGYNIIGLDFVESTVKKIQSLHPDLQFLVGDVTDFQFDNKSFDAILSWGVVEHFISGPGKALKEAYRILTKEGILFVTVPCKNHLSLLFSPLLYMKGILAKNKFIRKLRGKEPFDEMFFEYRFTRSQFRKHLSSEGFRIRETIPICHEAGFAKVVNDLLRHGKESKIFHKNKVGKWDGLTNVGNKLCRFLNRISPWMTPDHVLFVSVKKL